jgi:hypothetical protein
MNRIAVRAAVATGFSVGLLAAGINAIQPRYPQSLGNFLWAAFIVVLVLAVRMQKASSPQ